MASVIALCYFAHMFWSKRKWMKRLVWRRGKRRSKSERNKYNSWPRFVFVLRKVNGSCQCLMLFWSQSNIIIEQFSMLFLSRIAKKNSKFQIKFHLKKKKKTLTRNAKNILFFFSLPFHFVFFFFIIHFALERLVHPSLTSLKTTERKKKWMTFLYISFTFNIVNYISDFWFELCVLAHEPLVNKHFVFPTISRTKQNERIYVRRSEKKGKKNPMST